MILSPGLDMRLVPKTIQFLSSAIAIVCLNASGAVLFANEVDFARDIRPILSDRCFTCHGLDEESRKAGLALHRFESATKEGAIVPGNASSSLVMERISSTDPDEIMPPPSANKPALTAQQIEKFRAWIDQGAKYEEHWAFQSPRKTDTSVPDSYRGNPIDYFVKEKLKELGLSFSKQADPWSLVRRVYLDLIGLPPSPGEAEVFRKAFQKDPGEAASQLAEDLLSRPEYGERWARLWLDLARYADTNGYEKDRPRSIWPYRDWVINAINSGVPYDQFTIEQLAGDMLPGTTMEQRIATGFHRNTMINEEGGIDPLEFRYHAMVDRTNTTGTVWLGLTMGCAQCHTHKFDPVTHTDYYSFFALLNNADEPDLDVPDPEIEQKRRAVSEKIAALERELISKINPEEFQKWKEGRLREAVAWTTVRPVELRSTLPRLEVMEDDSVFASGDFTKRDVYDLKFNLSRLDPNRPVTAIRIEALPDDRLPAHGPGAAYYEGRKGDFFLSEVKLKLNKKPSSFRSASIDFGKIAVGSGKSVAENVYDNNGSSGWSTATQEGKRHELVLNLDKPKPSKEMSLRMIFERHFVAALGRFRVSVSTSQKEAKARGGPISDLTRATDLDWKRIYIESSPQFAESRKQLGKLRESFPAYPTTMVMREWRGPRRKTHRHHRGEYLQPREEVTPGVPAIFPQLPPGETPNRLALAKWLVSEKNPLAARVAVNRAWRAFFGRGLVHTAGDFGYQSELPSHPRLLDHLALYLIDHGWSTKDLHRLIVTSRTYQQESVVRTAQLAADPKNIYLSRGPRFRLDGEMIRDSVLHAGGLLTRKIGGPSVYPPQLSSVTAAAYGKPEWNVSKGPDRYRRSLYTFSKRTAPFAAFLTFDGPTGESCLARRERSNTPLQALTLLNDEMFLEAARTVAKSVTGSGLDDQKTVKLLFQRILTRPPTKHETNQLTAFYRRQLGRLQSGELKAKEISGVDGSEANSIAAWSMVARVLFNLDESITKG